MKQWLYNHCGDSAWPVVTDENGTHVVGGVLYTGCGISQSKQGRIPNTETNRKIGAWLARCLCSDGTPEALTTH